MIFPRLCGGRLTFAFILWEAQTAVFITIEVKIGGPSFELRRISESRSPLFFTLVVAITTTDHTVSGRTTVDHSLPVGGAINETP